MARSKKPQSFSDNAIRAQATLDYVIANKDQSSESTAVREQMPVSQALRGDQILHFSSNRTHARVLYISSDPEDVKPDSRLVRQIASVHTVFAEIHAVVLTPGKKRDYPSKRIAENAWLYHVQYSSTWFLDQIIVNFAESQMQLGAGFRPDVIVAVDPFYGAQAALHLGAVYDRPVQIHVLTDFLIPSYATESSEQKQKASLAHRILKRASSVRVNSNVLKEKLEKTFPKIEDLGMLPRHFDSDALVTAKRLNVLKTKYPQYSFMILAAGTLDNDNTIFRTLDAARAALFNPRIGMVIVGDGSRRSHLEERAKLLGVAEQVVFETNPKFLEEYMLSADMFVCTDTSPAGDEYIMQAAAAGLPIVMAKNALRADLFADGESALFCDPEDTVCFSQNITTILNKGAYRLQFGANAKLVVKDRLHTDPELYRRAYRDTVEVVFGNEGIPEGAGPDDHDQVANSESESET